jgi:hypothetical protein
LRFIVKLVHTFSFSLVAMSRLPDLSARTLADTRHIRSRRGKRKMSYRVASPKSSTVSRCSLAIQDMPRWLCFTW